MTPSGEAWRARVFRRMSACWLSVLVGVMGVALMAALVGCLPFLGRQEQGVLSGVVLSERGEPVVGAELTFRDLQSGQRRLIGAGPDGGFELAFWLDARGERLALRQGQRIELVVYKPGFQLRTLQVVVPGGPLRLGELTLQAETEELLLGGEERDAPLPLEQESAGSSGRSGRGE